MKIQMRKEMKWELLNPWEQIEVFLHDQHVQNKSSSIEHCPTNDMLADFFSKGALTVWIVYETIQLHQGG